MIVDEVYVAGTKKILKQTCTNPPIGMVVNCTKLLTRNHRCRVQNRTRVGRTRNNLRAVL